jgi:hypothetical protein
MGGWVVIGLLSISHDLLAPLLIHIRRKLYKIIVFTNQDNPSKIRNHQ